ncbi:DNA damage-induced apoptosis suppressor protein [Mantella aurantiaca]
MNGRRRFLLGTVLSIQNTSFTYPACQNCFSRLIHTSHRHRCQKCGETCQDVAQRYRLCVKVSEDQKLHIISAFGSCLETIFGSSADSLHSHLQESGQPLCDVGLDEARQLLFQAAEDCLIGRSFIFAVKVPDHQPRDGSDSLSHLVACQIIPIDDNPVVSILSRYHRLEESILSDSLINSRQELSAHSLHKGFWDLADCEGSYGGKQCADYWQRSLGLASSPTLNTSAESPSCRPSRSQPKEAKEPSGEGEKKLEENDDIAAQSSVRPEDLKGIVEDHRCIPKNSPPRVKQSSLSIVNPGGYNPCSSHADPVASQVSCRPLRPLHNVCHEGSYGRQDCKRFPSQNTQAAESHQDENATWDEFPFSESLSEFIARLENSEEERLHCSVKENECSGSNKKEKWYEGHSKTAHDFIRTQCDLLASSSQDIKKTRTPNCLGDTGSNVFQSEDLCEMIQWDHPGSEEALASSSSDSPEGHLQKRLIRDVLSKDSFVSGSSYPSLHSHSMKDTGNLFEGYSKTSHDLIRTAQTLLAMSSQNLQNKTPTKTRTPKCLGDTGSNDISSVDPYMIIQRDHPGTEEVLARSSSESPQGLLQKSLIHGILSEDSVVSLAGSSYSSRSMKDMRKLYEGHSKTTHDLIRTPWTPSRHHFKNKTPSKIRTPNCLWNMDSNIGLSEDPGSLYPSSLSRSMKDTRNLYEGLSKTAHDLLRTPRALLASSSQNFQTKTPTKTRTPNCLGNTESNVQSEESCTMIQWDHPGSEEALASSSSESPQGLLQKGFIRNVLSKDSIVSGCSYSSLRSHSLKNTRNLYEGHCKTSHVLIRTPRALLPPSSQNFQNKTPTKTRTLNSLMDTGSNAIPSVDPCTMIQWNHPGSEQALAHSTSESLQGLLHKSRIRDACSEDSFVSVADSLYPSLCFHHENFSPMKENAKFQTNNFHHLIDNNMNKYILSAGQYCSSQPKETEDEDNERRLEVEDLRPDNPISTHPGSYNASADLFDDAEEILGETLQSEHTRSLKGRPSKEVGSLKTPPPWESPSTDVNVRRNSQFQASFLRDVHETGTIHGLLSCLQSTPILRPLVESSLLTRDGCIIRDPRAPVLSRRSSHSLTHFLLKNIKRSLSRGSSNMYCTISDCLRFYSPPVSREMSGRQVLQRRKTLAIKSGKKKMILEDKEWHNIRRCIFRSSEDRTDGNMVTRHEMDQMNVSEIEGTASPLMSPFPMDTVQRHLPSDWSPELFTDKSDISKQSDSLQRRLF